ncbi:MAG: histidine kinase [Acidobacteria bacterium]|nr:histidine kinase [Acidobacteriota bacterium]
MNAFLSGQELLFLVVLKVGLSASLAALLARSRTIRKLLFTEERDSDQKVQLMLFLTPPLLLGVMLRLFGYHFADLMLEGGFILGLLGGRVVGPIGGAIISLPALASHEWLSTPMAASAGLLGGLIRQFLHNTETIWNFGPFTFVSIPRWFLRLIRERRGAFDMLPLATCGMLEITRVFLHQKLNSTWLFSLPVDGPLSLSFVLLSTVMAVSVPIKIWNNTRIEMKLEQHQQLLLKARMDALSAQINPHFLFNTLNTVSSLIRVNPDMARVVVIKLSNILRRLLRKQENFASLRDEIAFIDDYLDIEVARFGAEKLRIVKELEEGSLDAVVPCMLLQPIIENSIKHGLAPRLDGGEVFIRTWQRDGRVFLEIEDNGIGIPDQKLSNGVSSEGIGISNVKERLRVLYGDDYKMEMNSQQGIGTRIRIELPELVPAVSL